MQSLPGARAPGPSPLATPSSKILWIWAFQTQCEFPGWHRPALCRVGSTVTGLVPRHGGDELTRSFHGDNGNARKDQGRADLEAMMLCSPELGENGLG